MRPRTDEHVQPIFNDIHIDLRPAGNPSSAENDRRSQSSTPSRIARYSEYPQVRPTNPLYSSQSTVKTPTIQSRSSATLVDRRQKFDPQAPRRPSDWRWLAILCIVLFFPLGVFAFAFARKAQTRFQCGFIIDAHKFNKRALVLCILSILCGVALIIGLLFGFDAWPRTNG